MQQFIRMKLPHYMEQAFAAGDGPDVRTLRRGIDRFEENGMVDKAIPGERIGNDYYVWVEPGTLRLAKQYAAKVSAVPVKREIQPVNDAAANLLTELGFNHVASA